MAKRPGSSQNAFASSLSFETGEVDCFSSASSPCFTLLLLTPSMFPSSCRESSIPVDVARQRELKWLEMFSNWDKWLSRRFQKVWKAEWWAGQWGWLWRGLGGLMCSGEAVLVLAL